MGEVITRLGKLKLNNADLDIELNEGVNCDELIVHFQTEKFRMEMKEVDFISASISILAAARQIKKKYD